MHMRATGAVMILLFLLASTSAAHAYEVSYSSSTPTELSCPTNATLTGQWCYCDVGFKVSGTQCVKDETMPTGTYDIYEDIRATIDLNDDKSCNALNINGTPD
ncbi:MAG: hypothetical protein RIQ56_468, partial [Candidatus Parcubacteria bacterium]